METALPFDLSPTHVARLLKEGSVEVVDVREPHEREVGHIDGSRHVPLSELTTAAKSFDPARPVVFVCRVGARSAMAAWSFARAGYDAHNLDGGMLAWVDDKLPIAPEGGSIARH
jgi:rhodanese-related sulfurtransferase